MTESKELTVVERAAIALGADEGEKQLIALAQKYTDITDIKNPAGRTQCHAAAMELGNARINVDKTGKAAREDANAFQKAVIAEVARRVAIVKPEEDRLLSIRDDYDAEVAREKAAKLAAEQQRVAAIRQKIDAMRNRPAEMVGMPSDEIGEIADVLSETVIDLATYMEFAGECQVERDHAVKKLREMQATQQAVEQAVAEAARHAEADRIERERVAEANRVEAKRLADLAAELERQAKEARDKQAEADRLAREQREAADREAQTAREEADRIAAAKLAERQAEMDRQQAAIDAAKAEQERIAREAQEAAEAEAARIAQAEADRIFAEQERVAAEQAAEAARVEGERRAALAEQARREHTNFIINGPGDAELVKVIAEHYDVELGDAMEWFKKFDYVAADEHFAAANVKRAA
ncbi:coiled-coil domain-containing protein [Paraburkholderia gardini]|uniref:hypothetical protein n=1 Tax=Paraburkholderia gardini TaxID=2823469 RepID=UPI001E5609F9|nr:hypothetical protein [Paraburkholderia gardini]